MTASAASPAPAPILVVDPDPLARRFVAALLRQHGHDVDEATDGDDALDAVRERVPRLIVAETGILETLRTDRTARQIPVLLLSGRTREERVLRNFEPGAEDYLTKPFQVADLVARAQAILARGRA